MYQTNLTLSSENNLEWKRVLVNAPLKIGDIYNITLNTNKDSTQVPNVLVVNSSYASEILESYSNNQEVDGNIALNFGFNEKDIKSYGLDKYVFSKELIKDAENNEKIMEKIKEFFNKLIYYTGPIQCAIKTREALLQINEMLEKLSNRKDEEWIKFQVKKI